MRITPILPLFLAPAALAQSINTTYLSGLLGALTNAGLTQLAQVAESAINTTGGHNVLALISQSGTNYTVFAPNNAAFAAAPSNVTSNTTLLGDLLSYHVVTGSISAQNFSIFPNHTVARSVLNDTTAVHLEGNRSQVIVFTATNSSSSATPKVTILNQPQPVTVISSTNYSNLIIHVIGSVLSIPGSLSSVATNLSLDAFTGALDTAKLLTPLEQAHGVTIFAPSSLSLSSLGANATNQTIVSALLGNHYINGTTVYSSQFANGTTFTSASGETFTFNVTANGTITVGSGNSTSRITKSDVLTNNGVIHVLDKALLNTDSNAGAASSAFQSATQGAANSPTQTGPITNSKGAALGLQIGASRAWAVALFVGLFGAFFGGLLVL